LIFTGGEPTLREDLLELLDYAEQLGQVTGLNTDGKKLTDATYFENLLRTGLDHLTLIFDPEDRSSWAIINQCVEADIFFTVHLTITLENAITAPEVISKLSSLGVKNLSLSTPNPTLFSTISDLRDLAAEQGLSLIWDIPVPYSAFNPVALELREEDQPQGAGTAWLYIEPDGDILPSQGIDKKLGNFLKDTWENIWSTAKNLS
jgi:MoaA/NifB/PqqE/SkfB family radical SAM enzyme